MATYAAQGKALLAESKYTEAIEKLTQALAQSSTSPDYLILRSTAYQRAKLYPEALRDADAAVICAHNRAKRELITQAQLRRGIALFNLERYGDAKLVLDVVKARDQKEKSVDMWLSKTTGKLKVLGEDDLRSKVNIKEMPEESVTHAAAQMSSEISAKSSEPPKPTPAEKIRHEWYQTSNTVYFSLLARGVPKDRAEINITEDSVGISFPIEASGSTFEYSLEPTFGRINTSASKYRILPSKIEFELVKATPGQKWITLESTESSYSNTTNATPEQPATTTAVPQVSASMYPTSSKSGPKNWDKIAVDNAGAEEDEGGDANKFFQQLYKGSSADTQRAMMKSYYESNGTALSTNWDEVSKGKVETVPPDGMEAKEW